MPYVANPYSGTPALRQYTVGANLGLLSGVLLIPEQILVQIWVYFLGRY